MSSGDKSHFPKMPKVKFTPEPKLLIYCEQVQDERFLCLSTKTFTNEAPTKLRNTETSNADIYIL